MLRPLDVLWISDDTIRPPGPKMVACLIPKAGWFYRVNSRKWPPALPLSRADHPFLKWDSFLECGEPLELDDYVVEESLAASGVIGQLSPSVATAIVNLVRDLETMRASDQRVIIETLMPLCS